MDGKCKENRYCEYRYTVISIPPSGHREFPPWGACGLFLERPNVFLTKNFKDQQTT